MASIVGCFILFEARTHPVAQASLTLMAILPPRPPKFWDYRDMSPLSCCGLIVATVGPISSSALRRG